MELNYVAILIAALLQFIFGAAWYTFVFGKVWGDMHGFNNFSKEEQQKMMKGMGKWYALQFGITIITTVVLALFIKGVPGWNAYGIAFFVWLGFVVPTQVSEVVFGGTDPRWIVKKIAIMAEASLVCLLIAAATLKFLP